MGLPSAALHLHIAAARGLTLRGRERKRRISEGVGSRPDWRARGGRGGKR